MTIRHLHRTPGARRLLLIFTGWSTDSRLFAPVRIPSGWDATVCSGFDGSPFPEDELRGYDTVYVLAWSLGVAAAAALLPADRITAAFAVNGTELPADDCEGIPLAIFCSTRDNLSPRNLAKFRRRVAGSAEAFAALSPLLPDSDDIEALRRQLDYAASLSGRSQLPWRKAFISEADAIFPPHNMRHFWSRHPAAPAIVDLRGAHLPDFSAVVAAIIPDRDAVAESFRRALPTYDIHASAQLHIAETLTRMAADFALPPDTLRVLEIGPGSGLFSRCYAEALRPAEVVMIDLYDATPPPGIAPKCTVITADAEDALASDALPGDFDMILSASTMQWFANPRAFFLNAAARLRRGGAFICSTFLPGNLRELDPLRPSPVVYHPEADLRRWLDESFDQVRTFSEELPIHFPTARQALMHLRHTGVAAGASSGSGLAMLRALGSPCTLTYRPLYIAARKSQ